MKIKNKGKKEVLKAIKKLEKRDDVLYVGPDYIGQICSTTTNDTYFSYQSPLKKMQFNDAWDISKGDADIKVGVIDTGIDITHPDLVGKVDTELSYAFVRNHNTNDYLPFSDVEGHGTHVAGIIGANTNNNNGIAGAAYNVSLVSLKAFNEVGKGVLSDTVSAINYAKENGIKILNLSARFTNNSEALEVAVSSFDGIIICAAGNDAADIDATKVYPACLDYDNIITVGNSDHDDILYNKSNYGKTYVDLFATGKQILSTFPKSICNGASENTCSLNKNDEGIVYHPPFVDERGYHTISGTSQAAPFVTATAALLLSKDETLTPKAIKLSILENVDKVSTLTGKCATGGRLNAYKALTNRHTHNLTFIKDDSLTHTGYCYDCGYVTESQSHSLSNGTCSICTAHFHSLSGCTCIYCGLKSHIVAFKYLNNFSHSGKCRKCKTTVTEPHVILAEDIGKSTATCQGCFELLDLSQDIATTYSLRRNLILTDNGSYMMSNGIIVLIGNDVIKYKKGELSFS